MNITVTRNMENVSQIVAGVNEIAQLLKAELGNSIIIKDIQTSSQGEINSTYLISLEHPSLQLYLKTENSESMPKLFSGQIEREIVGNRLFEENNIPVAKIIAYDINHKMLPFKYMISERVKGLMASSIWGKVNLETRLAFKNKIQAVMDTMKNLYGNGFGAICNQAGIGKYDTWGEALSGLARVAVNDCINMGILKSDDMKDIIISAADHCKSRLTKEYRPCFSHLDLNGNNLLVDFHNNELVLKAIVDFGCSIFGVYFLDEYRINAMFNFSNMGDFYDDDFKMRNTIDEDEFFSGRLFFELGYLIGTGIMKQNEYISHFNDSIRGFCTKYLKIKD